MPHTEGYVLCWGCGKRRAAHVPRGGDGSALRITAHGPPGDRCTGSFHTYEWSEVLEEVMARDPLWEHVYAWKDSTTIPGSVTVRVEVRPAPGRGPVVGIGYLIDTRHGEQIANADMRYGLNRGVRELDKVLHA